jgi:CRP/FNR family transcriptional regulator
MENKKYKIKEKKIPVAKAKPDFLKVVPKTEGFAATLEMFKKLPPVRLAEVEKKMVELKFKKGKVIHLVGDSAEFVWFVKEGHVKAMVYTPNGRTVNLCVIGPRGMFGCCCCFNNTEYPCQGVAESATTVYSLPMRDFNQLLNQYPEMSRSVLEIISKRLRHSKGTQVYEQESVEKRVLYVLVNMVKEFGAIIPMTRREIAEMAGTTVETCIRTFTILEEEGLVSTERCKITIVNLQALMDRLTDI